MPIDGNEMLKKLQNMTDEQRSAMFFDSWYGFFEVREAFNYLIEKDEEACEYASKLGTVNEDTEIDDFLTVDEMTQVIREALEIAWESSDERSYETFDFIQEKMQEVICALLQKKAEEKQENKQTKEA